MPDEALGRSGPRTRPHRSLEFCVTEVTTAIEQLFSLPRDGLGLAETTARPLGLAVPKERSVCWAKEPRSRWGAVADIRPTGGRAPHSRSELFIGCAGCNFSLWRHPEAQKLDKNGPR